MRTGQLESVKDLGDGRVELLVHSDGPVGFFPRLADLTINLRSTYVTTAQQAYLDLIRCISFNEFSGSDFVEDLLYARDLWVSVIVDGPSGVILRDLPICFEGETSPGSGLVNLDTVYILTTSDKLEALLHWAHSNTTANEIDVKSEGFEDAGGPVVRLWWD